MDATSNKSASSERRRERRRRDRLEESQSRQSGTSTPKTARKSKEIVILTDSPAGPSSASANGTFSSAVDFIPFDDDDDDKFTRTEQRTRTDERKNQDIGKGKGKERERDDTPPMNGQSKRQPTPPIREWDRDKVPVNDKDEKRAGGRNRDRDREDSRSGGKRKYDEMVFDFNDGYANKKQRTDASSRKAPWIRDMGLRLDKCNNVAELLHQEVEAFVKWISPSPVEDEVRGLIVAQISRAVTSQFPDAKVLPFGSFETKLYLPLGDIDLVIISESMAYSDKITVLHALANTLKRSGITNNKVTIIAKAKVPIVKFVTMHGRFHVDISINQQNGITAGGIVKGFLRDMHGANGMALRSLVMITKAFLSQRSMNEVFTGGLGSYSIVCLAVSFLQMHPKIRRGEIDAEKNLGVLVMEFFELYGCYFNYEEVGISVRDGGTYFSKKQRGWYDYYKTGLLAIEDPADVSNDISKGSFGFNKVRTTFAGAHGILTAAAFHRAGLMSSRKEGRYVNLRGSDHEDIRPEDMSILSTVMGVTQETINHRKLVQEVYDNRTLHNLLGIKPQPQVIEIADDSHPSSNGVKSKSSDGRKPHYESNGISTSSNSKASSSSTRSEKPSSSKRAVQTAWEEADMDISVDDVAEEEEEGGRYDIGLQPPKKRARTGRDLHDAHTVFITDDDDEDEDDEDELKVITGDTEDEAEEVAYGEERKSRKLDPNMDKRRSYWLSKGIGIESNDSA